MPLLPPGGTRKEVSEAQSLPSFPLKEVPSGESTLAALIIRSFFTSPGIPAPSPPRYRRGREGLLILCDCLVPLERSLFKYDVGKHSTSLLEQPGQTHLHIKRLKQINLTPPESPCSFSSSTSFFFFSFLKATYREHAALSELSLHRATESAKGRSNTDRTTATNGKKEPDSNSTKVSAGVEIAQLM